MTRHFLDLYKLEPAALRLILDEAVRRKAARAGRPAGATDDDAPAAGRLLAMIFERRSTRTRFSMDAAVRQLGGGAHTVDLNDLQLGRAETQEDTARSLSRLVDAVMIRAESHDELKRFAYAAAVPVINGLSNRSHPCQVMADLMTLEEHRGAVSDLTLAWVGDGNNVCASWIHAAGLFGFRLRIACPPEYHPDLMDLAKAAERGGRVEIGADPREAVHGADAVLTDTWVSMGDVDYDARFRVFEPYQVDAKLMAEAAPHAVFLHNLPALRGEEVTDEVIDGPRSLVWHQVENHIHVHKAILLWCWGLLG